MSVSTWDPNGITGKVTFDVSFSATGASEPGAPCSTGECTWVLDEGYQGYAGGPIDRVGTLSTGTQPQGTSTFRALSQGTDQQLPEVTHVMARLLGGGGTVNLYEGWSKVADPYPMPHIALAVKAWNVDASSRHVDYQLGVRASSAAQPGAPCSTGECTWVIDEGNQGWPGGPINFVGPLAYASEPQGTWSFDAEAQASDRQLPDVTHLRTRLFGGGGTVSAYSPWIKVSDAITRDFDLVAAAEAVQVASETEDPCNRFLLVPGPHQYGSSAPDTYLDCEAGTGGWVTRIRPLVQKYGVAAGIVITGAVAAGTVLVINDDDLERTRNNLPGRSPKGQLDDSAALALARSCLQQIAQAGLFLANSNPCEDRPIFFPGSDVASAAQHDFDAMFAVGGHPEWLRLNYVSGAHKLSLGYQREWYRGQPPCNPEEPNKSCDEYPYFTTAQGGAGRILPVSLRKIDETDNRLEGSRLGNFVRSCRLESDPTGGTNGADYLVVPMVGSGAPPTTYVC